MATTKNITMKQFNGTDYDTLYPQTVYNQVSGVARAGYALGSTLNTVSDANTLVAFGCYATKVNTPTGDWCTILHIPYGENNATQYAKIGEGDDYKKECVAKRDKISGNWKPWEWVNPPMQLGVEYRTTERYFGKPVYTQVISIGAIGSGSGNVEHGIPDISVVVDLIGTNSYGPTLNTHPYMTVFYANSQYVRWETTQAISGTSYAVLRYTKTTD